MVWASVCLSVCLSVTLLYCVKTVQARITISLLWAVPRTPVYRDKISCPWVRGFPRTRASNTGPPKRRYLPLLALIVWKRLQIGTDLLHILTSTGDRLFKFIDIDDLEWPWTFPKGVFSEFFAIFGCCAHSILNCDEMAGDRPRQPACEIFSICLLYTSDAADE